MKKIYFLVVALGFSIILKAQVINIPDVNFKAKLLAANSENNIAEDTMGNSVTIDVNNDGKIELNEALAIAKLNVESSGIHDLTGIENFLNLSFLICDNNNLTSLDVSNLLNLDVLFFQNNQIVSVDVNGLTNLRQLGCGNNKLTSINVSNLANLKVLWCNGNELSVINVNNLNNLSYLDFTDNTPLTAAYLKTNMGIGYLEGFQGLPNLQYVCIRESEVIEVQNQIILLGYNCTVDSSCLLSSNDFGILKDFVLYPNPVENILNIETKNNFGIESVSIYNMLGQLKMNIPKTQLMINIDVSHLPSGNYIIKMDTEIGALHANFIKN